jgi:hypothetical protein
LKTHHFVLWVPLVLGVALAAAAACDPVHSEQMDALGGEAPGVRTGPTHRPGQPCTVCHDGKIGSPSEFSVAGTIFRDENDAVAAVSATVTMTDANGTIYRATTNGAGNFYASPNEFSPSYPMKTSIDFGGIHVEMTSEIGRAGACAGCHVAPAGPTSPGRVFVPADGGTP